jgi:hypothetical protein
MGSRHAKDISGLNIKKRLDPRIKAFFHSVDDETHLLISAKYL